MFDKLIEIGMLYDFYGKLLTNKQQQIMNLYYEEDYSLGEIGDSLGVSRQAIHDTIKKSEKALHEYEMKLGLLSRFLLTEKIIEKTEMTIDRLIEKRAEDLELTDQLQEIKAAIDQLER